MIVRLVATPVLFMAMLLLPPLPSVPTPEEQLAMAVQAYTHGDLNQARDMLEGLRRDTDVLGGRAAYLLGVVAVAQKDYFTAEGAFGQAAVQLPILADHARYYQAVIAFEERQYGLAIQRFRGLLEHEPTSTTRGLAVLGWAESLAAVHSRDAVPAFHQYLEEFPQGVHAPQAWFDMGQALEKEGNWEEATQAYRRVVWGFAASPYAVTAAARLSVLAQGRRLPPDATPPEVFYQWALTEIDSGEIGPARSGLERILTMRDGWRVAPDVLNTLGMLAFRARRLTDAERYFEQEVKLRGGHGDDALYWLERIALVRGREGDALDVAHRLIREYPQSPLAPRALYAIGEVREDRGATASALALYQQAADQFPATRWGAQAAFAVGWVGYRAQQWESARAAWLRLAERAPDADVTPAALYWAARAAASEGRRDLAEEDYRRVATQYGDTYYGQRAAVHLGIQVRIAVAPPLDFAEGEVPPLDRYRELDALGQTDDALGELEAAATLVPPRAQELVYLLLSQRYAQQGDIPKSITTAEQARDAAGVLPDRALPLALWEALYPKVYWDAIDQAAYRTGADPYLIAAIIREESRFNPQAGSPAGAYGLMQLLLRTARNNARSLHVPAPDIRGLADPATNILLGAEELEFQLQRFGGREDLALAAYNAGPGTVHRWEARRGGLDAEGFVEEIPYLETRMYVKTVQQSAAIYRWLYRDGHPTP
jgi:soluble lytic murein transglycosylase